VAKAEESLKKLSKKLYIAPYHKSIEEMTGTLHSLRRQAGEISLVCVDYLQLCKTQQKWSGRNELLSIVSAECASWRHGGPCVIAASQLNRQSTQRGENTKPRLEDLRDSGSLEQDGDSVWLLHTTEAEAPSEERTYSTTPKRTVSLEIAKQRNGPTGEISLLFAPDQFEFYCP
jgi:replicative DNA helicase